jgi:hypothetical protein
MVAINIHDRLLVATGLDVFVLVACHIAKGGLLNVIGKKSIVEANNGIKSVYLHDTNMLKATSFISIILVMW